MENTIKILVGSLLFIYCFSCHDISFETIFGKSSRDTFAWILYQDPLADCLDSTLQKCISSVYFVENDYDNHEAYYNVYFFRKDSMDYFTIWMDEYGPEHMLEVKKYNIRYDYYWFQLFGKDVFFIKCQDDHRKLPFNSCVSLIDPKDIKYVPLKIEDNLAFIRDRFNMLTFQYYFDGEKYHIGGLRDTIYFVNRKLVERIEMPGLKRANESHKLDPKKLYPVFE